MAVPVIETTSVTTSTFSNTVAATKPTSTASGDLLVAFAYAQTFGANALVPPGDWSTAQETDNISFEFESGVYYKLAGGSEGSTYTFTATGAEEITVIMLRISGVDGTTPVEASTESTAAVSGGNITFPSVTSITNDALILLSGFAAYAATPSGSQWPNVGPTSTTIADKDAGVADYGMIGGIAYFTQASAGATGTKSVAIGSVSTDCYTVSLAIKPAGGGGATDYTADLTAGSFAVTGSSLSVPTARNVALTAGSFAVTGSSLTVPTARNAALTPGSFSVTGTSLTVPTARNAALTPGSFSVTGSNLSVPTARNAALSAGSFAVTGSDLTVPTARNAALDPGSFSITGSDVDGVYVDNGAPIAYAADLDPGAFTLTGSEVDAVATGQSTADTHDGIGYGDPFRRKRRPKKGKREKAVEDLLKKLMGLVPDDPPPEIEAEAEIAQASVERLFAPTVDVTPNLEALQFAQLQLAKLEAMLNRYLEDEEDDDDLLLMAA